MRSLGRKVLILTASCLLAATFPLIVFGLSNKAQSVVCLPSQLVGLDNSSSVRKADSWLSDVDEQSARLADPQRPISAYNPNRLRANARHGKGP